MKKAFIILFLAILATMDAANIAVRKPGAGTFSGADWSNAASNIVAGLAAASAGDTIWLADDHAETNAALTITSPGTASAYCSIISANTHVTFPPTGVSTTASIVTTNANAISYAGFAYMYGVNLNHGSGAGQANAAFNSSSSWGWILDSCNINFNSTGNSVLFAGLATATGDDQSLELRNTNIRWSGTGQKIQVYSRFNWNGGNNTTNTANCPTTIFIPTTTFGRSAYIAGVDFSIFGSGKNLVSAGVASSTGEYYFRNCKLGASVSPITGTITSPGGVEVTLDNCDSTNTNYRFEHYKYQGSIVNETTVVRTGGASDGTTPLSHKFVTLASGASFYSPLCGPWMSIWNETTGSVVTNTVEFLHGSTNNLQNSDIYLEIEGMATSSFPLSVFSNNRTTSIVGTAADCPAGVGVANWTTNGVSNANSQMLQVSYTPQVKGIIRARVCVAKTNYTVYVDPVINTGSGTGRRQYNIPTAIYNNELSNPAASSGGAFTFSQ